MSLDVSIVPHVVKDQKIYTLLPSCSAYEAAKLMSDKHIASIMVVDETAKLIGIVTERDMTYDVVAHNLNAAETPLADIMTANPVTADPAESAFDALERVRDIKARHLPLVDNGQVVGIVSMKDLRHFIAVLPKPKKNPLECLKHWLFSNKR